MGISRGLRPRGPMARKGFTLIELLIVFAVSSVLLGMAVPSYRSFQSSQTFEQAAKTLGNDLRFVQSQSLGGVGNCSGAFVGWFVTPSANSYTINYRCGTTNGIPRTVVLPAGVILGNNTSGQSVLFSPINSDIVLIDLASCSPTCSTNPLPSGEGILTISSSQVGKAYEIRVRTTGDIYQVSTTPPTTPTPGPPTSTPTPSSVPTVTPPPIPTPTPTPAAGVYYMMDEGSWSGVPGEVIDSSGANNHATAFNGATTTVGKIGNGGNFDGVNDYVLSGASPLNPQTTDLTAAVWFKPSSIGTFQVLMAQQDGTGTGRYWLAQTAGGLLGTNIIGTPLNGTTILSPNTWYHAAFTKSGSTIKLYLNGIQENTATGTVSSATGNTVIGANKTAATQFFTGTLDEARIYDRALSAVEIAQLYNPAPTPTPTSVAASPTPTPAGPTTKTFQVGQSFDDVNELSGSFDPNYGPTYAAVYLGASTFNYTGLRFTNVTIPKGATITSAKLEGYSVQDQWIGMDMTIAAESIGNSPTFSSTNLPSQRFLTTQTVSHASNTNWVANTWYQLDEMASVIQQVVNHPSWLSGNNLSIIVQGGGAGDKFVESFDGSATNAPKLVVTYQ